MSTTALKVQEGASIKEYDTLSANQWSSLTFFNCNITASASAANGAATLTITLNTPLISVSKSFAITGNTSFTWQPVETFKVTLSIANFSDASGSISFDLGISPCIGTHCFNFSNHFVAPVSTPGNSNSSLPSSLLASNANAGQYKNCNDNTGTGMLGGDIYNTYLGNMVDTEPPMSCMPCTGVAGACETHVWAVCAASKNKAGSIQGGYPVTPQSVSLFLCGSIAQANAQAGYPITPQSVSLFLCGSTAQTNTQAGYPITPQSVSLIFCGSTTQPNAQTGYHVTPQSVSLFLCGSTAQANAQPGHPVTQPSVSLILCGSNAQAGYPVTPQSVSLIFCGSTTQPNTQAGYPVTPQSVSLFLCGSTAQNNTQTGHPITQPSVSLILCGSTAQGTYPTAMIGCAPTSQWPVCAPQGTMPTIAQSVSLILCGSTTQPNMPGAYPTKPSMDWGNTNYPFCS